MNTSLAYKEELPYETYEQYHRRKKNPAKRKKRKVKKNKFFYRIVTLAILFCTSLFITNQACVRRNSADLGYAVEYDFTNQLPSEQRLLRVKNMTLISRNDQKAVVEADGLSSNAPHTAMTVRGNFIKDSSGRWILTDSSVS